MAIAASTVLPANSLEDFRLEFNTLVSDVSGITATNKFTENIIFEGATADAYETTLVVTDPTADRTITLPNSTGTLLVSSAANPASADGAALGTTALEWSDLYLADGGIIYLGNDQDVTLTHVADTGVLLNSTRKIQFGDSATFIHQSSDGVMTIDGEATIDLNASTAVLVSNDLKLNSDSAVLGFGADNDITLTHAADTGLLLNSTRQLQFNDSSQYISGASATKLDIRATDEIELTSTLVDIVGALTVSGTTTLNGALVLGDAAADTLTVNATLQGASPLTFEGGTADGYETTFAITDPTADRTITFPNLTGTVSLITATETLTNKTLTTPTITAGVAATSFDMNGTELFLDADADTSITADSDDQIDFKISGADDFRMTANTFTVLSGSTLTIASGATIDGSAGTITGFASQGDATALAIALG
jgi:hypothetical protein